MLPQAMPRLLTAMALSQLEPAGAAVAATVVDGVALPRIKSSSAQLFGGSPAGSGPVLSLRSGSGPTVNLLHWVTIREPSFPPLAPRLALATRM